MSGKKKNKKSGNETKGSAQAPSKITLPAFGLAEDILGPQGTVAAADNNQGPVADTPAADTPVEQPAGPASAGDDGEAELHLVTFTIEREDYGVEIGSVQEIIRVGQVTPVPNSPEFVKGVINLRGRVIPVINLRRRLDLSDGTLTKNSRIMIIESGSKVLGLLVDGVSQVLRMPVSQVDAPPGEVEQSRMFVRGIGKVDSRLIMIMDLGRVLAKENQPAG